MKHEVIAGALIASLLSGLLTGLLVYTPEGTYQTPIAEPEQYTYLIGQFSNSSYYAKNGTNSQYISSWTSTNFSSVCNNALNIPSPKGNGGLLLFTAGNFTLTNTIYVNYPYSIEGAGVPATRINLADKSNCSMLVYNYTVNNGPLTKLSEIFFNGNKGNQYGGEAIVKTYGTANIPANDFYIENCWLDYGYLDGLVIGGTGGTSQMHDFTVNHVAIEGCQRNQILLEGGYQGTVTNSMLISGKVGVNLTITGVRIVYTYINSVEYGIWCNGGSNLCITGNYIGASTEGIFAWDMRGGNCFGNRIEGPVNASIVEYSNADYNSYIGNDVRLNAGDTTNIVYAGANSRGSCNLGSADR